MKQVDVAKQSFNKNEHHVQWWTYHDIDRHIREQVSGQISGMIYWRLYSRTRFRFNENTFWGINGQILQEAINETD